MIIINKPSWAEFKALLTSKRSPWQHDESPNGYFLFFEDGGIGYTCSSVTKSIPRNEDQIDWEDNYKNTSNKNTHPVSYDGTPRTSAAPAVEDQMYFWSGVCGTFSGATSSVDWVIPHPFIQLQGARVSIKGSEKFDKVFFEVGMYMGETWVTVTQYGDNLFLLGGDECLDATGPAKSNPIPQGMILRVRYVKANPSSQATQDVSIMYKMWRAYAS